MAQPTGSRRTQDTAPTRRLETTAIAVAGDVVRATSGRIGWLGDELHRLRPSSLPYPVKQRVALTPALVSEPDLLFDQPAGGLSEDETHELGELSR